MNMHDNSHPNIENLETHRVSPPEDRSPEVEYPVREYIASMSRELAQMARWDGDETLAVLLEAAAARALVSS